VGAGYTYVKPSAMKLNMIAILQLISWCRCIGEASEARVTGSESSYGYAADVWSPSLTCGLMIHEMHVIRESVNSGARYPLSALCLPSVSTSAALYHDDDI
jgi:hypothetical protein